MPCFSRHLRPAAHAGDAGPSLGDHCPDIPASPRLTGPFQASLQGYPSPTAGISARPGGLILRENQGPSRRANGTHFSGRQAVSPGSDIAGALPVPSRADVTVLLSPCSAEETARISNLTKNDFEQRGNLQGERQREIGKSGAEGLNDGNTPRGCTVPGTVKTATLPSLPSHHLVYLPNHRLLSMLLSRTLLIALLTSCLSCSVRAASLQEQQEEEEGHGYQYGLVVDAGSSGTRMRMYRWRETSICTRLPAFEERLNIKKTPGISQFVDDLDGLRDYMRDLMDIAVEATPAASRASIPIYIMATAGMRLLWEPSANAIMARINALMEDQEFNPFSYEPRNTRILSGEEEGSFAWIAVNYLLGVFDSDDMESAGILELGGASTQIAFLPEGAILADKWPMKIARRSYALYVHSYLYYGQELTVLWAKEHLARQNPDNTTLINPCMLEGDVQVDQILGREVTLVGSGDPEGCQEQVDVFVYKSPSFYCHPKPCAIASVYQPTIGKSKRFYALSAFLFNLRDIGALDGNGSFTPEGVREAANIYCRKTYDQVKEEIGGNEAYLSSNCLMGLYMATLFTKGYGFSPQSRQIVAVKKIKDTSLEWSLGAIIYEHEREDRPCAQTVMCAISAATTTVPSFIFPLLLPSLILYLLSPYSFLSLPRQLITLPTSLPSVPSCYRTLLFPPLLLVSLTLPLHILDSLPFSPSFLFPLLFLLFLHRLVDSNLRPWLFQAASPTLPLPSLDPCPSVPSVLHLQDAVDVHFPCRT